MSMPEQPRYTPADIERYLNGNMSAEESYALEQAAWRDPLLEQAIEGFLAAKEQAVSTAPHLQSLNERIKQASQPKSTTTASARVVPMTAFAGWKSIAAAFLALAALSLGLWMMFKPSNDTVSPVALAKPDTPQTSLIAQEPIAKVVAPAPSSDPVAPTTDPTPKKTTSTPPVLAELQVPQTLAESEAPLPITESAPDAYKPTTTITQVPITPQEPNVQQPAEDLSTARNQEIAMVEIAATNQAPRNLNMNDQRVRASEIARQGYQSKESNKKRSKTEAEVDTDNTVRLPTRRHVSTGLFPLGGWEKLEQQLANRIIQHPSCSGMRGQPVTVVFVGDPKKSTESQWRVQTKRISADCEAQLLQILREQQWEYNGTAPNPEIQWIF